MVNDYTASPPYLISPGSRELYMDLFTNEWRISQHLLWNGWDELTIVSYGLFLILVLLLPHRQC